MFECSYKFTIQDAIKCAKYVYRSQRRKQEKIVIFALPFLLLAIIAMLVFDIIRGRQIVWDIILIVGLFLLGGLTYSMPLIVKRTQIKQYTNQGFGDMDSLDIKIINGVCEEAMVKNGENVVHNTHNLKTLISYIEDDDDFILVYNTGEYTCIKKNKSSGDLVKLRQTLQKAMTVKNKSARR